MKKNMLLIIGLVFMMMFGVTGNVISKENPPFVIVKRGAPVNSSWTGGSSKRFARMNTGTVWFVNAEEGNANGWVIKELQVYSACRYLRLERGNYSVGPNLRKWDIPQLGWVWFHGWFGDNDCLTAVCDPYCRVYQEAKPLELVILLTYREGLTYKYRVTVKPYSTVYLYRQHD